jgi:hypothetical protein
MAGQATVVNAIALALSFYWPSLTGGAATILYGPDPYAVLRACSVAQEPSRIFMTSIRF